MDEPLEAYLKALLDLVKSHQLSELSLQGPQLNIRLRTRLAAPPPSGEGAGQPGPSSASASGRPRVQRPPRQRLSARRPAEAAPRREHAYELRSPLTGVFYRSASPETGPFVAPGDYVRTGQVVCMIEAMKVFNEIHAERSGRLLEVCAANGEVVSADQALMLLDPHATPEEDEELA